MIKLLKNRTFLRTIYWNGVLLLICLGLLAAQHLQRTHHCDQLISDIAGEYQLDPRLVAAVIWKESRFRSDAVGSKGEIGLMQLTEPAAREWAADRQVEWTGPELLFNPENNIRAGCWYLSRAIDRWSDKRDPLPFALAEYNAGRTHALRWDEPPCRTGREFAEQITYPSTHRYIRDILTRYRSRL